MQSNFLLSILRGEILFDSTFQSLGRDENEIKLGDPGVTAVNYGEHIFYELPISSLKSEWGKRMKNSGKELCKEVYI